MAEGVLFDIAGKVLEGLGPLALRELNLASNVKAELTKLEGTVSIIKAVLLDAEDQHNSNNREVTVWLRRLKDAVYDVDDLLDDFSTEVLRRKIMKGNEMSKKVRIFFSKSNQLSYRLKMGHRVQALREKLDAISADRINFHFNERLVESQIQSREREQTHSFVRLEEVIGRDGDKSAIIELLLETHSEESIRVVPIVGFGGLGKTTLAQMVFIDEKVRAQFELKLWVCVSDRFEVQTVVEKVLEVATQKKVQQNCQMEILQNDLRKEIDGKKYLLVLDDVWNEDAQKWSKVKNLLMGGARGSRIVVTTRSELVGRVTGTISPYFLGGLSESQSLSLFKQMTFEKQIQTSNFLDLELETIGEKIVKYCAGVPLAIRSIGSVLCLEITKSKWSRVLEHITQKGTGIEPILRLSYDHLPSHLKQCFAYCSLFPKDYRISKHALIKLWMAQGFIQSQDRGQSLEDVGHDYFMDLLWRSFFQEAEKDNLSNMVSCKMHDLMHDLAKSVAGTECFVLTNLNVENLNKNTRHVSFGEKLDFSWKIPSVSLKANKIRTFFQSPNLKELGVWGFNGAKFSNWLSSITNLVNIQILACEKCRNLPSMDHLPSLKFLRLWNLRALEHVSEIEIDTSTTTTFFPSLESLRIRHCPNLKGWWRRRKEDDEDDEESTEASTAELLPHFPCLSTLEIRECPKLTSFPLFPTLNDKLSLGRTSGRPLQQTSTMRTKGKIRSAATTSSSTTLPLSNLKSLTLYEMENVESALKDFLQNCRCTNLDTLNIDSCPELTSLQTEVHALTSLQKLTILTCPNLMALPNWIPSLTSLQELQIRSCHKLQSLPEGMSRLTNLRLLVISDCPRLSERCERDTGADWAKISHVPDILIG
ncbi:putative disease resistance protein RGA4 [Herrania umbratica]|uniref:Disease resistance protein RGA4 n=1 Tax=Herrania umbratica TaxID=108875 RepID=A0A6J1BAT1_9ROSI|nr:putative disease resistance protein RGA4 [Herrania umbratica]XP_021296243.1 putative disease resistance protein RGA4 [Herrania umbratica]